MNENYFLQVIKTEIKKQVPMRYFVDLFNFGG